MFLVVALAALSFLAACSGGAKDQIARKWQFSEMQNPQMDRMMKETEAKCMAMDDSMKNCTDTVKMAEFKMMKEQMESTSKMMKDAMENMKANSYIEFNKDGKYTSAMGGQNDGGTWSIDADGKNLITVDSKEKADTLAIEEISAEKLVLASAKDSMKIVFVAAADSAAAH